MCVILVFTGLGIWRAVANIYKKRASPVSSSLSSTWLSLGEQHDAGGHERIMGEQLTLIRSERHSGWPQDPRRVQPNHSSHWLWQMSAAQCPTPTQKSNHWSHWGKNPPLDRFTAHGRFCFLHMATTKTLPPQNLANNVFDLRSALLQKAPRYQVVLRLQLLHI